MVPPGIPSLVRLVTFFLALCLIFAVYSYGHFVEKEVSWISLKLWCYTASKLEAYCNFGIYRSHNSLTAATSSRHHCFALVAGMNPLIQRKYRVIGIESRGAEATYWVVADSDDVLNQRSVNRIIKDIHRRILAENGAIVSSRIWFYSSVLDKPKYPSFRITDHLAVVYNPKENKTHFSVRAKEFYRGWAHGPKP